jgi:hypothetical protein
MSAGTNQNHSNSNYSKFAIKYWGGMRYFVLRVRYPAKRTNTHRDRPPCGEVVHVQIGFTSLQLLTIFGSVRQYVCVIKIFQIPFDTTSVCLFQSEEGLGNAGHFLVLRKLCSVIGKLNIQCWKSSLDVTWIR